MTGKDVTLYSHVGGPNGWKVAFILKELGLTYNTIYLDFNKGEHKAPEFTKFNPNGRIPAIVDHKNNDFVLWESGAILEYLVQKYDKDHKISASNESEKFQQLQWLFFQSSGQGPYYGQGAWFKLFHSEKLPSAIERYENEIKRVLSVLESVLSKQEWLVGNKLTVSDLSFVPWNKFAFEVILGKEFDVKSTYPSVAAWHEKLSARPSVKEAYEERSALQAKK